MDIYKFPDFLKLELGLYVENLVNWLRVSWADFFSTFSSVILWILLRLENFLNVVPWWVVLILVFLVVFKIRNLLSAIVFSVMLFLIGTLGLWTHMTSTMAIVITAVFISIILGIPVGILMSQYTAIEKLLMPVLDAMQTLPSFVYLIPAIMFFGLGLVPATFATILFAVPPVIRLTNLGIRRVSKEMVEAAESFGPSTWQLLYNIKIPQAIPTIMAGINQTTMMALSMVVIASMVGARGLGAEVYIAINRIQIARGFDAGISIVFLAIIIDRITQSTADHMTKKYYIE